MADIKRG